MKTRRLQFLRSYVPSHLSLIVDFSTKKLAFSTRLLQCLVRERLQNLYTYHLLR